jgi:hypothetical protein
MTTAVCSRRERPLCGFARTGAASSRALRALCLACMLVLFAPLARSEAARARIGVSVVVVRPATVQAGVFPAQLEISTADIRRGYVDWQSATRLLVGNINPVGYVLDVSPTTPIFSQVQISTSPEQRVTLGADGGQVVGWRGVRSDDPLLLTFRFKLHREIAPGRYPWPVHVDARVDY